MQEIRALRADEIEVRVGRVTAKGAVLLLYKDARCDMTILDETYGVFGWQRRHELINGKEFCTVLVRDDNGEWVSKQDCGTESATEKLKGETSDAFKRACVNWGIGRELYTKLRIFAPCETVQVQRNGKAAYELKNKYEQYSVQSITIDKPRQKITSIEIADSKGNTVFTRPKKAGGLKCEACGAVFPLNGVEPETARATLMAKYNAVLCPGCRHGH